MKLTLPLPPPQLGPNARVHYMTKALATKRYRTSAHAHALAGVRDWPAGGWRKAVVRFHFYVPNHKRRDIDGLEASMKSAVDGIVDAGVLADDSWKVLTRLPSAVAVDRKNPRVEVVVTPDEAHYREAKGGANG